jgi:hypothetical protein
MNRDLENLSWLLRAPGLLKNSTRTPQVSLIGDDEMRAIYTNHRAAIEGQNPQILAEWLEASRTTRRLGRYVESLSEWVVSRYLDPSRLAINTPVQDNGRTIGELDLLFEAPAYSRPQHWELSVKFYICTASNDEEARESRFFMGTFVEDRLDQKVEHLFHHQLPLTQTPAAESLLRQQGWPQSFENRALMKGLFFYPSDQRFDQLPDEVSAHHDRGWWTTASQPLIPQRDRQSRYLILNQLQWLGLFNGQVSREALMTKEQIEDLVRSHFAGDVSPAVLRRRELTVAEVEIDESVVATSESASVREISRGHFVHEDWPALARWAAEQTLTELERSKRENSKRRG